jgi:hypothetical protein
MLNKNRIGKKGGAKRIAEEFSNVRKAPLSKELFSILDAYKKDKRQTPTKKSAKTKTDLDA